MPKSKDGALAVSWCFFVCTRLTKKDARPSLTGAFKLLAIQQHFHLLDNSYRIVDLCAAPGSWSQVFAEYARQDEGTRRRTVVAVDLHEMKPIEGVIQIRGDITSDAVAEEIIKHFNGQRADLVVCDGAPDVINLLDWDQDVQAMLVDSALRLACKILEPGGGFVSKVYRTPAVIRTYRRLQDCFTSVTCAK